MRGTTSCIAALCVLACAVAPSPALAREATTSQDSSAGEAHRAEPSRPSREGCTFAGADWSTAVKTATVSAYQDHLARFPNCTFATLARARIAALALDGHVKPESEVVTGWLGLQIQAITPEDAKRIRLREAQGALVTAAEGPAAGAGIRAGDAIVALDGNEVSTAVDLSAAIGSMAPGEAVRLVVVRRGRERMFKVTLAAINRPPQSAVAYWDRGNAYWTNKDLAHAVADFGAAIAIDPKFTVSYMSRGDVYSQMREYDSAISDYTEAIALDHKAGRSYGNRGYAYYMKQDYDRAISDYGVAIALDAQDARSYYRRGLAKRAKGDIAGGEDDIAAARRIDPQVTE